MTLLLRLMAVFLLAASMAFAQEATPTLDDAVAEAATPVLSNAFADQAEWDTFATRVEAAISAGRASNTALGDLRSDLADWRDIFLDRQSLNGSRIETVEAQIEALGASPEGDTVDPRVQDRRDALNAQLAELRAPVTLAREAYTRADGMIGEIDHLIRERQADEFAERVQSPLNPSGWATAWDAIKTAYRSTRAEISQAINNPSRQSELVDNLPLIFALLALAVVCTIRGRDWVAAVSKNVVAKTRRGQGVWSFILSLGQVIVPLIGLLAFTYALQSTDMLGRRFGTIVAAIPAFGMYPILAHWLAGQLLPEGVTPEAHPLMLEPEDSAPIARAFIVLGYALAVFGLVNVVITANSFGEITTAVLLFPVGAIVALALFRLGQLLRRSVVPTPDDAPRSFRVAMRGLLSRGVMIAAVAGLVLAIAGYSNALELITMPAAATIYVLGILLLLQKLSVDGYTLLSSRDNAAQEALIPVLIGFALVLLAVPILAIIWGAQVTDLTEIWARVREGFSIGETKISPSNFFLFALVFIAGYTVTRLIQGALRTTVLPRTRMDLGGQNAIVSGTGYIGIFLAAVIAITTAGIDLSGLAIVAGALSVGIGFGLQNIVSNFVSGIILLIERPISQGDWIEVGGQMGYVRDISVRSTRIETFDRTDVIVPNADLVSNQVTNWTRGNNVGRVIVPVGVAYGTDTDWVAGILKDIAEAHPMVLLNPGPAVVFQGFGADSLDFEIRAILRDVNYVLSVKSDMNHAIAKRFTEEGIEIPFAQRDLWLRNPETLQKGDQPVPAAEPAPKPPTDGDT